VAGPTNSYGPASNNRPSVSKRLDRSGRVVCSASHSGNILGDDVLGDAADKQIAVGVVLEQLEDGGRDVVQLAPLLGGDDTEIGEEVVEDPQHVRFGELDVDVSFELVGTHALHEGDMVLDLDFGFFLQSRRSAAEPHLAEGLRRGRLGLIIRDNILGATQLLLCRFSRLLIPLLIFGLGLVVVLMNRCVGRSR